MSNLYLLEKIGYVSQQPTQFVSEITKSTLTVENTFAYDPDSKTAPDTAKRWAERSYWGNKNKKPSEPIVKNNDPFTIQIISLESRVDGGRAYKVIDDQNRMFDLREDQVIEALAHGGIQKGGKVNGEFVWGKNHTQMKLAYVGGEVHKQMILGLQKRKSDKTDKKGKPKRPYTSSKLAPGGVYSNPFYDHRSYALYVGVGKFKIPSVFDKKIFVLKMDFYYGANVKSIVNLSNRSGKHVTVQKSVTPFEKEEVVIPKTDLDYLRENMFAHTNGFSKLLNEFKIYYDNNVNPLPSQYKRYGYCGYHYYDTQHSHNPTVEKWSNDFNQWFKDNFVWID